MRCGEFFSCFRRALAIGSFQPRTIGKEEWVVASVMVLLLVILLNAFAVF